MMPRSWATVPCRSVPLVAWPEKTAPAQEAVGEAVAPALGAEARASAEMAATRILRLMSTPFDPRFGRTLTGHCANCGRAAEAILIGPSAPVLCGGCGHVQREHERERALSGPPYPIELHEEPRLTSALDQVQTNLSVSN